jgi:hypothetical protein
MSDEAKGLSAMLNAELTQEELALVDATTLAKLSALMVTLV